MRHGLVLAALCAAVAAAPGAQGAFETYGRSWRVVQAPPAQDGSFTTAGAALADGRLIAATGNSVYVETGVGTGQFALAATIESALFASAPDPAFLRVSPDGSRIALGGGLDFDTGQTRPILVFDTAALASGALTGANTQSLMVEHFGAAWMGNDHLAVSAGDFGSASRVDLIDVTGAAGVRTIVQNIQGASAGVAFDSAGRLYTGNGFALGTPGASETGWIKAFDASLFASGGVADFEADGVLIGRALSASPLAIDGFGNLAAGGGDFFGGDFGYAALMHADAVADALAGFGAVDAGDPGSYRAIDPAGTGFAFYGVFFNGATGEMVLTDGSVWFVSVPGPGVVGVFGVAGVCLGRGRRRG